VKVSAYKNPFIKRIFNLSIFLCALVVIFFLAYVAVDGGFAVKVACLTAGVIVAYTLFFYDVLLGVLLFVFALTAVLSPDNPFFPQAFVSYVAGLGLGAGLALFANTGGSYGNRS
jgi:hypothetical protein